MYVRRHTSDFTRLCCVVVEGKSHTIFFFFNSICPCPRRSHRYWSVCEVCISRGSNNVKRLHEDLKPPCSLRVCCVYFSISTNNTSGRKTNGIRIKTLNVFSSSCRSNANVIARHTGPPPFAKEKTIKILIPIYSVSSYTHTHERFLLKIELFFFFFCVFLFSPATFRSPTMP